MGEKKRFSYLISKLIENGIKRNETTSFYTQTLYSDNYTRSRVKLVSVKFSLSTGVLEDDLTEDINTYLMVEVIDQGS
jgi:hypothetical protein